ncbi:transcription termination factor 4, mitochondrial [Macrobrachium rosenbergii]|uniref:transcription termination factor 4, mitochondrial n=1 Tax=Macrobrachium rosenbergii TaxID=79674 RepID=UPI0034D766F8
MGLEQAQIAASEALQKSLFHIKVRHQFLYRAGLYKTPELAKDSKSHKQNADLSLITDTSNKFFVNKIARLTESEYEVFYRMMKEEHDLMSDDEESDGSYSDEE